MTKRVRFSQDVERATEAVNMARGHLLCALQKAYPIDSLVRVIHSRGEYMGWVVGHDIYGARVVIKNEMTDKITRQYFKYVELAKRNHGEASRD